jgi:hypothetical protein
MAEDMKPADPVTENQNILMGKPVKAFSYQDHEAHIQIHMAAMQDPKITALLANNPQAQQLQAAALAHVNEHIGYQYRIEIEKQLGMDLPAQKVDDMGDEVDVDMDPMVERQLSPRIAQAAQALLLQNRQQAAAQQAQQQAQDPIIQMQMQELQLKAQEQQRKAQKDATDAQLKLKQLDIEAARIAAQAQTAVKQISAGMITNRQKLAAQAAMEKTKQRNEDIRNADNFVAKTIHDEHSFAAQKELATLQKKEVK